MPLVLLRYPPGHGRDRPGESACWLVPGSCNSSRLFDLYRLCFCSHQRGRSCTKLLGRRVLLCLTQRQHLSIHGCVGFRVLEAGAGTGGLTKDALPLFETDMHHELLRYCATDITSAFSTGLMDAVRSPKLIFKVPPRSTLSSADPAHLPLPSKIAALARPNPILSSPSAASPGKMKTWNTDMSCVWRRTGTSMRSCPQRWRAPSMWLSRPTCSTQATTSRVSACLSPSMRLAFLDEYLLFTQSCARSSVHDVTV